ncbi:hypothetical protein [Actinacidiphila oryziradicis]|uniref:Uncharacterized protein n=1 Tax=Actinacidiphila oryziradicis TaxID=2571141 RepID=A0A4U0SU78_9ACTN|nr:hypothetical protein [Actinacidiphila oryziradicis]TKA12071.1 hypothetical protein FCI23_07095 [Actinacidiphila oryziradicis]
MRRPNHTLAEQLALAGWRPPQLVAAVNALLGDGYLSRSTVSEWLHAGRVPREPLPAIVAQLLSEAAGNHVPVRDLWPRAALAPVWTVPADDGLADILRAPSPTMALATDWIRHADRRTGRDRRRFTPALAAVLPTTAACNDTPARAAVAAHWSEAARAAADLIAELTPGPEAIRFAYRQTLAYAETLIDLPHNLGVTAALAITTHAAGKMAHETGALGLAQRYHLSSTIFSEALTNPSEHPRTQ